ncbi:MAG: acyl-phosphate glycerol 3-phosphate acyltransferase [Acidimicrobiaceae bacterium]|jgi:glycerol-3-phosphate acyltransferase PlsY|nr:acyl-phosphate glycerol 3-phosphate acyltransferase [Acidimicrobiaceae bacterium]|tara:strand:+ start:590 stop:1174 length:585 start_codon:yes stop_codon:yes gene_type:complete
MYMSLLLVVVSYFIGTFPSAHLVAGRVGLDPTKRGSGNPGAANVYRIVGQWSGIAVFFADFLKGVLAASIGYAAGGKYLGVICWGAATLGHVAPLTRRLRGGKGVATAGGGAIVLFPIAAAICFGIFFVVAKTTRKASLGSITIASLLPLLIFAFGASTREILFTVGLSVLIILRHYQNIQRLLSGTESSFKSE